jgi:hypothetical protein
LDRIGIKCQLFELAADPLQKSRMAVPYGNYGVPTIQIKVLRTLFIPNVTAFAPHRGNGKKRIYIKKFHNIAAVSVFSRLRSGLKANISPVGVKATNVG